MNELEQALFAAGYVQSPNNIHSLPGTLWYASGPGLPSPSVEEELQVVDETINVLYPRFMGIPYVNGFFEIEKVATFTSVPELQEWLLANRELSLPGLPAFSNSWD